MKYHTKRSTLLGERNPSVDKLYGYCTPSTYTSFRARYWDIEATAEVEASPARGETPAAAGGNSSSSQFLDLPPELRTFIYELAFEEKLSVRIDGGPRSHKDPGKGALFTEPGILRSCKSIRREALSLFYTYVSFCFVDPPAGQHRTSFMKIDDILSKLDDLSFTLPLVQHLSIRRVVEFTHRCDMRDRAGREWDDYDDEDDDEEYEEYWAYRCLDNEMTGEEGEELPEHIVKVNYNCVPFVPVQISLELTGAQVDLQLRTELHRCKFDYGRLELANFISKVETEVQKVVNRLKKAMPKRDLAVDAGAGVLLFKERQEVEE